MLVISMAILILIQLTLFNDCTQHFSQKAIFCDVIDVTLLRTSQRRERFLMRPGTRFVQEMVRIPSLQKIAHYYI